MKNKNILALISSILLASSSVNASFLPTPNPYKIGPEGRSVEDLRDFAKPNRMFQILPNRPIVATDSSGSRLYYTPNGRLAVSISKDGKTTYSLNGITKTRDAQGNLTGISRNIKGTNKIEVMNEFGELLSTKETGIGGKIIKEYDKDNNLTKTYEYNKYGKTISAVTNEMTKGKTVFDEKGLASYELDYEGNRMAKYEYDDKNRMRVKTDMYGNKTHFSENSEMLYTENKDGVVLSKYNYVYDDKGNHVLESSFDPATRETTYFENGKQTVSKNYAGAVTVDYLWNGSQLVSTFNRENQETTWYDVDGRTLYTSFNDEAISKNLYHQGQLVGIWDVRTSQVTIFKNERREVVLQLGDFGSAVTQPSDVMRYSNGTDEIFFKKKSVDDKIVSIPEGFNYVNTFKGYVLAEKEDGSGNIIEYEPVVEPTGELIKQWIDAGLVEQKMLVNPV
ncbi:MAG: hypothetical protein LBR69_01065 [Endomicrobium sp.]|jgi:hypothetical protein|nr:hypothetical protein [Endomicrobium sp.]